jgi:hypothetical protein
VALPLVHEPLLSRSNTLRESSRPRYSRISIAAASRSRSMYASPLTSMATRRIVPPVKGRAVCPGSGCDAGGSDAADAEGSPPIVIFSGLCLDLSLADLRVAVTRQPAITRSVSPFSDHDRRS